LISEAQVLESKWNSIHPSGFPGRYGMAFSLTVVGGILLAAFSISRLKTQRAAKPNVQTLFSKK